MHILEAANFCRPGQEDDFRFTLEYCNLVLQHWLPSMYTAAPVSSNYGGGKFGPCKELNNTPQQPSFQHRIEKKKKSSCSYATFPEVIQKPNVLELDDGSEICKVPLERRLSLL